MGIFVFSLVTRLSVHLRERRKDSLFRRLMGTNRYHFSLIPKEHQLQQFQTDYQYFIKHEDIVKHVNFKRLRDLKGSVFAFHGSPQENWHSILRSGLQIGKGGYLVSRAASVSSSHVIHIRSMVLRMVRASMSHPVSPFPRPMHEIFAHRTTLMTITNSVMIL